MSKPNLKSQAKRKRELAKLGKRQAKDDKRAQRRAERSGEAVPVAAAQPANAIAGVQPTAAPRALSALERWKSAKPAAASKPRR